MALLSSESAVATPLHKQCRTIIYADVEDELFSLLNAELQKQQQPEQQQQQQQRL